MKYTFDDYLLAARQISDKIGSEPEIGVFLGSGLGSFTYNLSSVIEIKSSDIHGFPRRDEYIKGHSGKIIVGSMNGRKIIALSGRFHIYEGFTAEESAFPVRVFKLLGVKTLIVTNAAGGISDKLNPGDLMLIEDHLSFFCPSPLSGPNIEQFGTRFPDVGEAYNKKLIGLAKKHAKNIGVTIKKGIYAYMKGPMYESPAEVKALRFMGADAVGMSTVAEVITAAHAGMSVLGISCIANMAVDLLGRPITHEEVIEVTDNASKNLVQLIENIINEL